jgi:AcrR family transcriptional regulator
MVQTRSTPVPAHDAKARLLDAARALFADRGYTGTSIGQLAEHAGVNRALIYYYFRNKRALYQAVIDDCVAQVAAAVAEADRAEGGARRRIETFVQGYYGLLTGRADIVRIGMRELTDQRDGPGGCLAESLAETERWLERVIADGVRAGELRRVNPAMAAVSLLGIVHGFMRHRLGGGRSFPLRAVVAHALQLFVAESPRPRRVD